MIGVGEWWSLRRDGIVLAILSGLAIVAAAQAPEPGPTTFTIDPAIEVEQAKLALDVSMNPRPKTPSCERSPAHAVESIRQQADVLYREQRFGEAAALIRAAAHGDTELESLATLYHQLDTAWAVGMTRGHDARFPAADQTQKQQREFDLGVEVFEALVTARRLDVVLGGAFCQGLLEATRTNVSTAALAYIARRDYDNAARALAVADAYGVTSDSIVRVRRRLRLAKVIALDVQFSGELSPAARKLAQ